MLPWNDVWLMRYAREQCVKHWAVLRTDVPFMWPCLLLAASAQSSWVSWRRSPSHHWFLTSSTSPMYSGSWSVSPTCSVRYRRHSESIWRERGLPSLGKNTGFTVHGTLVHGTPVHGTLVHGTLVHGTPVHGTLVHGRLVHGTLVHGTLVYGTLVHGIPVHGTPVHGTQL